MIRRLIVARHGESDCNVRDVVNGDPAAALRLTDEGMRQARELAEKLVDEDIDVAFATEFARTQETARLALGGRPVEVVIVPELNDPPGGSFEDRPLSELLEWLDATDWHERVPGGGESQIDSVRRFISGWQSILDYPKECALVVAHAFAISFALTVAAGSSPAVRRKYDVPVSLAQPHSIDPSALAAGLGRARTELASIDIRDQARGS